MKKRIILSEVSAKYPYVVTLLHFVNTSNNF